MSWYFQLAKGHNLGRMLAQVVAKTYGVEAQVFDDGTVQSINVLLGYLGSQEKLSEFHAGLETSGNGRGGVEAGGHLSSGQTFGESGQGSNYAGTLFESTSARSLGTQEAIFNFVTDLKQATLQAIQAAPDVPSNDEVFRSVA